MTSRERFRAALEHRQPDRPPIDLGATWVTGISASTLAKLRAALGMPDRPPRVHEPFQLLGFVEDDLRRKLGIDVVGLWAPGTIFGFKNTGQWKPWVMPDATPVLVSSEFETAVEPSGDTVIYPQGNRRATPSGRLPVGGYFFDAIVRQGPLDDDHLDPSDWADSFSPYTEEDLRVIQQQADHIARDTDYGTVMNFGQGGLGDVAFVPGENLLNPRGLRDPNLWYEYLLTQPDYIRGIFELQTQMALKNLELLRQAVGDKLDVVIISGTDFGTQRAPVVSLELFRSLWKPYFARMNRWVHEHTNWKTFYHSCGSVSAFLDDFVEIGVDVLNPVQCSAACMEPAMLKAKYGDKLVFWGGGVDTQRTLPTGTPEQVRREVQERVRIFAPGGGFVFNTIHNIQGRTPPENIIAMFEALLGRSIR